MTSDIIECLMPVTNSKWWFASTYFVMYLIHPFLNKLLLNLDKKTFQIMLLFGFVLFSLISTFFNSMYQSNVLIWFVFLYCVASYIRLFGGAKESTAGKSFLIAIGLFALMICMNFGIAVLDSSYHFLDDYSSQFFNEEKLLPFLVSLYLFKAFKSMDLKYNKIINTVSSSTFGVYLIHDSDYTRTFIWEKVFKIPIFQEKAYFIPYTVAVAVAVFVICSIIDLARINLLEKPVLRVYDKCSKKFVEHLKELADKIRNRIFE